MKRLCVLFLMLALFGCEEGSGGGHSFPVKPPPTDGGGTTPVEPPPVEIPSTDPDIVLPGTDGKLELKDNIEIGSATGHYDVGSSGADAISDGSVTGAYNKINGTVWGSYAIQQDTGNAIATGKVTLDGAAIGESVYGAFARAIEGSADASDTVVTISDSEIAGGVYGGMVETVNGDVTALNNDVTLTRSRVDGGVYGAHVSLSGEGSAAADGNSVILIFTNVEKSVVGGGVSLVSPAKADIVFADGNVVDVFGSSVKGSVLGGFIHVADGATVNSVSAEGNIVTLANEYDLPVEDMKISGRIVGGGYAMIGGTVTEEVSLINNTVQISGYMDLTGTWLQGGWYDVTGNGSIAGATVDMFSGNTLSAIQYTGSGKIDSIGTFQFFEFTFDPDVQGSTPIFVTENLYLGNGTTPSEVSKIQYSGATEPGLKAGDVMYLITTDKAWNWDGKVERTEAQLGKDFKEKEVTASWGSLFTQQVNTTMVKENGKTSIIATVGATPETSIAVIPQTMSSTSSTFYQESALVPMVDRTLKTNEPDVTLKLTDYEQKVKYNANGETYVRHGKGHHRRGGMTQEKREERRAAWNALSPEEKEARRQLHIDRRNARTEGSLFERTGRHHRRGTASE
jgi:hypothetical protein